jgi:hypothetical protein
MGTSQEAVAAAEAQHQPQTAQEAVAALAVETAAMRT